jgi:hypothetical protein
LLASGKKREALRHSIDGALTQRFAGRVVSIDRAICGVWGDLMAQAANAAAD